MDGKSQTTLTLEERAALERACELDPEVWQKRKPETTDDEAAPWDEMGMLFETRWVMNFTYTNWRGECARRQVRAICVWFGRSEWHPEPQWFLQADDLDKNERRDFAMKDMSDVTYI